MPLTFSNKVDTNKKNKLLYDASNSFGIAHSTPAIGGGMNAALQSKMNPAPLSVAPRVQAPVARPQGTATQTAQLASSTSIVPSYDSKSGLLTEYGRSQGLKEVNGQQSAPATDTKSTKTSKNTATDAPTFGGILFDLLQKATKGNEDVSKARQDLTKFQTNTADQLAKMRSDDIPLEFQQGRAQVVQQAAQEKEKALQQGVANALEGQSQQLGALNNAAGLASPQQLSSGNIYIDPVTGQPKAGGPTTVPYNSQFLNPLNGQPVGGGATSGSLQDAVSNIAQKVQNGSIGYDSAVQALSGYGQAGVNGLQQLLGPNFNIQQSNALAAAQEASTLQTGTLGGQLQKQAETVKAHMDTLKTAYEALQAKYGLPLINQGINAVATQLGSGSLQSYNIALSNVRDELAKILGGGTSTDGTRATARELLPDNMTPTQLAASIKTAKELMDSKITEYTKTPSFNGGSQGGGTGGLYDW